MELYELTQLDALLTRGGRSFSGCTFNNEGVSGITIYFVIYLSNVRNLGCLGDLLGIILPGYVRIISQAIIRIPINQPGFHGK